jgi:hypothetical protein
VPSAKNIWQHFKDKTGSEFQDVPLDDIANKSTTMQDWFSARNKDLKRWLNDVHNDYTSLINQPLDPATDPNFPILDANVTKTWVSGLHSIVGGTQYASICLKTYSFDPLANHYQATCRITISDDFGVSSSDVLAANQQQAQLELALGIFYPGPIPNLVDGIKAFWILQHRRGYPSFIHKIQLTHTFDGSL